MGRGGGATCRGGVGVDGCTLEGDVLPMWVTLVPGKIVHIAHLHTPAPIAITCSHVAWAPSAFTTAPGVRQNPADRSHPASPHLRTPSPALAYPSSHASALRCPRSPSPAAPDAVKAAVDRWNDASNPNGWQQFGRLAVQAALVPGPGAAPGCTAKTVALQVGGWELGWGRGWGKKVKRHKNRCT